MSQPYLGEIRLLSYTFAPVGWADCDGSYLSIADNDALFQLLGTTFGGDGVTTFCLPDLRGRLPLHQGQGQGLTNRLLGERSGVEAVSLTAGQLPAHLHSFSATSDTASSVTPGSSVQLGGLSGDYMYTSDISGRASESPASTMISPTGGSQPHDNTMPTLTVRFCIATQGIFPSQA
ncbi:phage tail protein [Dyella subtropica]|uniref:phage tail protein n=1 Tax=Dyella subtropica TaxID=2992127 RepID=UPI0022540331|nr:tail fiber protein [Dyella subtropica]